MTEPALDPRVSGALTRYRIMAIITGTFLLAVFAGLIVKALFETSSAFDTITGVIAMTHGWIYIIYFVVTFFLAVRARWTIQFTVLVLAAGLIPLLIFWVERWVMRRLRSDSPELLGLAHSEA